MLMMISRNGHWDGITIVLLAIGYGITNLLIHPLSGDPLLGYLNDKIDSGSHPLKWQNYIGAMY